MTVCVVSVVIFFNNKISFLLLFSVSLTLFGVESGKVYKGLQALPS